LQDVFMLQSMYSVPCPQRKQNTRRHYSCRDGVIAMNAKETAEMWSSHLHISPCHPYVTRWYKNTTPWCYAEHHGSPVSNCQHGDISQESIQPSEPTV